MPDMHPVAVATPDELTQALHLSFAHVAERERLGRVDNALRLVQEGELDPKGVFVIRRTDGVVGAIVSMLVPGASALIWPPQAAAGLQEESIQDQLLKASEDWLRSGGAKLAQALIAREDRHLGAALVRNGYRHVTSLCYMRNEFEAPVDMLAGTSMLELQSYEFCDRNEFNETLLKSYVESRDCPEVNGIRTIEEIIDGHKSQGKHNPSCWWLARLAGRPVAVLLMSEIPEWQAWDLSYVGVVPEARGQGIGRELTLKALHDARAAGALQVTLAVDNRNTAAWNLYRGLDFQSFDEREVYLALWNRICKKSEPG